MVAPSNPDPLAKRGGSKRNSPVSIFGAARSEASTRLKMKKRHRRLGLAEREGQGPLAFLCRRMGTDFDKSDFALNPLTCFYVLDIFKEKIFSTNL